MSYDDLGLVIVIVIDVADFDDYLFFISDFAYLHLVFCFEYCRRF